MQANGNGNGHHNGHAKDKGGRPGIDPKTEADVILSLALGWSQAETARIFRLSRSHVNLINKRHLERMAQPVGAAHG